MIEHTSVVVSDYNKSKGFYSKALAPLGYTLGADMTEYKAAGFGHAGKNDFWIMEKTPAVGVHVAFAAENSAQVEEFYKAAIAAGGKDNGAPGYRKDYSPGYYAAFVYDPDGSNVEAVWHDPSAK